MGRTPGAWAASSRVPLARAVGKPERRADQTRVHVAFGGATGDGDANNGGTNDYCSPVYYHGSTYNHRCTGNDNRSSRYDGRPNHNHPVRSSVRSWRPSRRS